ncbi:MAG: sulfatase-like hydrolase/transferase [Candidatus Limnocylindrales bacterium]
MGLRRAIAAMSIGVACVAAGALATDDQAGLASAVPRPNVVIIYLDDVSPNTSWLWSNPSRTPELARFARHGVEFRHAVTSTPLCGPSRATLLTGRYGHGHKVTDNQASKLDPRGTLASQLKRAGYHTVMVGKYVNELDKAAPRRADVNRYAQGWKRFDVIWKRQEEGQGQFYGYRMWTRKGVVRKGYAPRAHSTEVVGKRVARHIRRAPRDRPVFALASFGAGHAPHTPLARHAGAEVCRGVRPYRAPSYDEGDVSDKPRYIRALPRLVPEAVRLSAHCEEMLGVDDAVARIRRALAASGRLHDTLLLFTADNGYLHGDHRAPLPGAKKWPHAVEVPLYALWPARLGGQARVVSEPVSNVDLPVTICALAGCSLRQAVGHDITPLLTSEAEHLDRRYLYTEMLRAHEGMPPWYGLITTGAYSEDATWQYTEYANGGRELYDLRRDPYRLRNLARDPEQQKRLRQLHRMLHRGVVRPNEVQLP